MVKAIFEHENNSGILTVDTHFGETVYIPCHKKNDESFRLGGTMVHEIAIFEGVILRLDPELFCSDAPNFYFRAFRSETDYFEAKGYLSSELWDDSDLHCYAIEYYDLFMEGKKPEWLLCKKPLKDANYIFINLDVLDGGGNVIQRYRVSPFTGKFRIMDGMNG